MIDLHCHSTYSDGSFSPAELLTMAEKLGLKIFSVTDHNAVGAYRDLNDPAVRNLFSGKLITGVELSAFMNGQLVDILGYGVDPEKIAPAAREAIERNDHHRLLELFYREYPARGIRLPRPMQEYTTEEFLNPRRFIFAQLVSEPENHAFFLDFEAHTDEPLTYYRHELYNEKSPLYLDCSPLYLTVEEAIDAIHKAGGLAFLAHSFCYTDQVHGHLDEITDRYPFDGLECIYPQFTAEQTGAITALCRKKGLLMSGGSDFHGELRPGIELGIGAGDFRVPDTLSPWAEKYLF